MNGDGPARSKAWRWYVCVLLLLATTINYMDRLTLSNTNKRIRTEFMKPEEQNKLYGRLENGFSWAFAGGSLVFGVLADRVNLRFLYPAVLLLWSAMGFASGLVRSYGALLACRTLLGLFEAGHWPCALRTVQRILERKDRAMGNGLLQSGASLGAIVTPFLVQPFLEGGLGWRAPFMIIGAAGSVWAVLWFVSIRTQDLASPPPQDSKREVPEGDPGDGFLQAILSRRFLALVVMVALINTCWQLLRAWLPLFLREGRGYTEAFANYFTVPYYVATDLGTLGAGFIALRLARGRMSVHASKCWVFLGGSLLTLLTILAARLPQGPALLALLLLVGFGLLGVFPCYYAFTQEISVRHQGKVNGLLGVCAWIATGPCQEFFGDYVDRHHSYDLGIALVGGAPLVALVIFWLLWTRDPDGSRLTGRTA